MREFGVVAVSWGAAKRVAGWSVLSITLAVLVSCTNVEAGASTDVASPQANPASALATPAQLALGKRSFIRCRACHTLAEGEPHRVGPNLFGMVGNPVASRDGFKYSAALAAAGFVWDKESLRAWIVAPGEVVPGNVMAFAGISDDAEVDALVAYLIAETQ